MDRFDPFRTNTPFPDLVPGALLHRGHPSATGPLTPKDRSNAEFALALIANDAPESQADLERGLIHVRDAASADQLFRKATPRFPLGELGDGVSPQRLIAYEDFSCLIGFDDRDGLSLLPLAFFSPPETDELLRSGAGPAVAAWLDLVPCLKPVSLNGCNPPPAGAVSPRWRGLDRLAEATSSRLEAFVRELRDLIEAEDEAEPRSVKVLLRGRPVGRSGELGCLGVDVEHKDRTDPAWSTRWQDLIARMADHPDFPIMPADQVEFGFNLHGEMKPSLIGSSEWVSRRPGTAHERLAWHALLRHLLAQCRD